MKHWHDTDRLRLVMVWNMSCSNFILKKFWFLGKSHNNIYLSNITILQKYYRLFLRRMIIPCNLLLGRYWILYCETSGLLPLASQLYQTNMVVRHFYCYQNQLLRDLKIHHLWACNRKRSFQDQPFQLRLFWSGLWKEYPEYTTLSICKKFISLNEANMIISFLLTHHWPAQ